MQDIHKIHEHPPRQFGGAMTVRKRGVDTSQLSIHVRRDSRSSIAYSEELISATMSATLQSTDRHDGIVGQECCHFQLDL
jgi:hypothetical protein